MGKCSSYHQGACMGTKECDACSCNGDESRCDFYPKKREKAAMDKPLQDWTLKDVYEYCSKRNDCPGCPFYSTNRGCKLLFVDEPSEWDLSEPPRWTDQERKDAKTILRIIKGERATVGKYNDGNLYVSYQNGIFVVQNDMFPSLIVGETVRLSEIAGEST